MYLRTPKRYTQGQRRSIISLRWLWLWILTPVVIFFGVRIYNDRETYIPQVEAIMGGVLDSAQTSLATAMAPTPLPTENPSFQITAAESAWSRGAIEEAITLYENLLAIMPNAVEPHYRMTLGLIMNGQEEEALEAAERTVTADPYDPDAWAIRAMALDWSGRYGEAIGSAQRAIELAGDTNPVAAARAQAFLAEAYFDLEQYDRALSTANRALETNPDSYEAYRNRALIVQSTQFDFAAALEDLETAHALAPNLPYITIDLALVHSRDDADTALALLSDVIEFNPANVNALYLMGSLYLNAIGDPSESAEYLSRCIDVDPDNINCHYVLGRAQVRTEQYATAAESFKRTIDLGSDNPYHYWWAGRAQVLLGSCPAATPYLQKGYQIALQTDDQLIKDSYEDQMRSCNLLGEPEATEEATEEAANA